MADLETQIETRPTHMRQSQAQLKKGKGREMASEQSMTQVITQAVIEAAKAAITAMKDGPANKQKNDTVSANSKWANTEAASLQLEGTRYVLQIISKLKKHIPDEQQQH